MPGAHMPLTLGLPLALDRRAPTPLHQQLACQWFSDGKVVCTI